jgi:flagellar biosynthesis GTPase FlhF
MSSQHGPETYTYRGRSLEELVPRIRSELGDDAVIVARRETTSGGVGGFFAKREIEVEVRPGESMAAVGPDVAAAFAQQLAEAHERQQSDTEDPPPAPATLSGGRPATGPEVDALPTQADVTVDDLFPAPPAPQSQGLAALFNAGVVEPPAPPAPPAPAEVAPEPEPEVVVPEPEPWVPEVEQPTGVFDYLGVGDEAEPVVEVDRAPEPRPEPEPEALPELETVAPEPVAIAEPEEQEPPLAVSAPAAATGLTPFILPPAARAAVERMAARGLRPALAEAVAEAALASLLPLRPAADPQALVVDALARRIPVHPLRRGPGVIGFVGAGGAGKTRCVARLAAAHARHGALPVAVLTVRSPDAGAELTRLLAPYDVAIHAVDGGAEGASRIAGLRGAGLVIVDTPGVSPRSPGELRALGDELRALAPDELHLTVSATTGPEAARELVGGVRELGVSAVVVTHTDETEILGTVIGLAIDCHLPLSYLARGQAVEAGLSPASPAELAADLLP